MKINMSKNVSRRTFLKVSATGIVGAAMLGKSSVAWAEPYKQDFTWISPRGTIEVVDDYPYWVAKELGYFGDLRTTMEPGPADATAVVKFVELEQADIGFPSPGVLSFALNNQLDLVSIYGSGAYDLFNFAFRKGEGVSSLKELEGKTVLLGSAGWQSICDPMFAAAGVDYTQITYIEAGWPQWGTVLQSGQGDAALSWEGLRADWQGKGLEFDYWLGRIGSPLPSNSLVVRRDDINDPDRKQFLQQYLRGWAMGSEFAEQNPRAATQIVFNALPQVERNLGARFGTESLMQIHQTFKGDMSERMGWGEHNIEQWDSFFNVLKEIGQSTTDIDTRSVVLNDFIADANAFDKEQVSADAASYPLSSEMEAVDVNEIQNEFFSNVINN